MKTQKLIDLQRKRLGLVEDARKIVDQFSGDLSDARLPEIEKKHVRAMAAIDRVDLDIGEERILAEELDDAEDRSVRDDAESIRPRPGDHSVRGDGLASWGERSGWADRDGNAVRVLRPRDNFATARNSDGVAIGDAVRAMVTGPRNEAESRALSEGTTTAGGFTVPTILAQQFIDRLRAKSVAIRAGALTVPMTSQTLAIARLETDPDVAWRAENAAIAEGDPTFGRVLFTAKTMAGIIKISRELMEDSINVGAMIERAFAQAMALKLDQAAIYGDGTANSPTGITSTSGINETLMGTNGAALTSYSKLIDAVYELQLDNSADPTAMIMHPRTAAALAKLVDANGNPLTVPEMISRIPLLTTTSASIAETLGSGTAASSIVFGDFSDLLIGMRTEIQIGILNERYAENGQIGLVAWMRADAQLQHKESFCRLKGIIA